MTRRAGWANVRRFSGRLCQGAAIATLALLSAKPAAAAERVIVSLGILSDSIQVSSLERYAKTGEVAPDLFDFLRFVPEERQKAARAGLTAPAELGVIPVAQFLYSPQGEILLERLGRVIESEARQPGFYAIRAALILAAADQEEGLTFINVLKKYPTSGIRLNLGRGLEIFRELNSLIEETQRATRAIEQSARAQAQFEPQIDWATQPDLRLPGLFTWEMRSLELQDPKRSRRFPVDLYLPRYSIKDLANPEASANDPEAPVNPATPASSASETGNAKWPLVVISHGLGSDRSSFVYLAKHLASHGFAVAVPEHPGSSRAQREALIRGRAAELSEPEEFIDRPLDITYMLDALTENRAIGPLLDLERVGVVGQSFGGYTALALAGAPLNLPKLRQDCGQLQFDQSWNVSLALQCRALVVLQGPEQFRDDRIKAIMALNPIVGSVFGAESLGKISVPTFVVASDSDTVAPALLEQMRPFQGIQSKHKYFALVVGSTHFSFIQEGNSVLPEPIAGPDLAVARRYVEALSLAFLQTHLRGQSEFEMYLSSRYAQSIKQGRLGLSLVRSLPEKLR
ncbi:MAG: alpha/beta fold hydrolase [Synechococcales cyanobacterium CRU_2_2]|nr:alpha/beta fold hydrolase [Synechococcales cyanobacterium CRU_2_2]